MCLVAFASGCGERAQEGEPDTELGPEAQKAAEEMIAPELPKLEHPIPLWKAGRVQGEVDGVKAASEGNLLFDLGDDWAPFIFSELSSGDGDTLPNAYRKTYFALANGEFPDDHHGRRAKRDKYLELYGIMPTISLLKKRFEKIQASSCAESLDLESLKSFTGFIAFRRGRKSSRENERYRLLKPMMDALKSELGVDSLSAVQRANMSSAQWENVEEFVKIAPRVEAIMATQERLECEGHYAGRKGFNKGEFDWQTHEALAEFEKRHRVYGWGFIGRDTIHLLRMSPMEAARHAVIRVLTERAMHAAGVLEDGSVHSDETKRTYTNAAGDVVEVRNIEAELREKLIEAFGLQTPESTYEWLQKLDDLSGNHVVAFPGIKLPEYYNSEMDLNIVVDRGDVWYEFPYDAEGKERSQPVTRRPKMTVVVNYNDQKIPLARFGTTVGGWRSDFINGTMMWSYKGSPVGDRVWKKISASPVWIPPETTPPKGILTRIGRGRLGVNYHETGPSYASAYGLVAAYHRRYHKNANGEIVLTGDQGIRSHGSVDYMSIMRRHSHGCHRLHNHIAVRLMSFVLKHRSHQRLGQQTLIYKRDVEYEDKKYRMEFDQGGYIFELDEPLPVRVLKGRVRGALQTPIEMPLPKYDKEVGAYVAPDGRWVYVDRMGDVVPRPMPIGPDGGLQMPPPPIDGGVPLPPVIVPAPVTAPATEPVTMNRAVRLSGGESRRNKLMLEKDDHITTGRPRSMFHQHREPPAPSSLVKTSEDEAPLSSGASAQEEPTPIQ